MINIYVTFGQRYLREPHPFLPFAHPDGYLTVEAPDYTTARRMAFIMTGGFHSFDYDERPIERFAPRGELARVIVHESFNKEE